jgi:MFS family permease
MVLAIVLVSYFMIVLDNSITFTGLPQIEAGLGLSTTALAWVQNAYTLVFGGLLLLGARAASWDAAASSKRRGRTGGRVRRRPDTARGRSRRAPLGRRR